MLVLQIQLDKKKNTLKNVFTSHKEETLGTCTLWV